MVKGFGSDHTGKLGDHVEVAKVLSPMLWCRSVFNSPNTFGFFLVKASYGKQILASTARLRHYAYLSRRQA